MNVKFDPPINGGIITEVRSHRGRKFEFPRWTYADFTVDGPDGQPVKCRWWQPAQPRMPSFDVEFDATTALRRRFTSATFKPALYATKPPRPRND